MKFKVYGRGYGKTLAIAMAIDTMACGASQPKPPCDEATLAAKLAECVALVKQCEPAPAPCPAQDACNAWADERQAQCVR